MSKPALASKETVLTTVGQMIEISKLDTLFRDLYTHLGPQRGWGQKEMWTHYDGYRVLQGGKLQALAGGDKRFGGTYDVVSFSTDYSSANIFARFAVVQRKRMMDWQKNQAT